MRKYANILLRILVLASIAGFVLYRMKYEPVRVVAHTVERGSVTAEVMGTGTLTPHTKTTVSPKIQGRLVELNVDQNDIVTTGQLLARLDDSDLREQVAIAKANLDVARATLERVQAEDARAKAVITQAQVDYERTSQLESSKMVATSDADKSRESLQVAQAEVARAVAAIGEARQQIAAAEKTLRYQEAKLADSLITAPFPGMITRRDRDAGARHRCRVLGSASRSAQEERRSPDRPHDVEPPDVPAVPTRMHGNTALHSAPPQDHNRPACRPPVQLGQRSNR